MRRDMAFIFECSHKDKFHISKHTKHFLITMFLTTFRRFPTTFRRFPKIFQNWSKGLANVSEHFPKVTEDFRGGTDDVSIIQHHLWVLFTRLCNYSNGNLKTCDNNLIFSNVKLSYFYMWKYMDFLSGRNRDKTLVSI